MDMQPDMGDDMGGNGMQQADFGMDAAPQTGEFDADFDAGVDADEEQDPKRYIQQLTGKLSQTLQKYSDENGQPDVDLNKYVAGMITKQAMKGLSEDDAQDILDKVKAGDDFSAEGDEPDEDSAQGQGGLHQDEMPQEGPQQGQEPANPMGESFRRFSRKPKIREIVNGVLDKGDDEAPRQEPRNNSGYRSRAYTSPDFSR